MANKFILMLLVALFMFGTLDAQTFEEEVHQKVPMMLKALNYNKTLKEKIKRNCVVAVLYNPESDLSVSEKDAIKNALNKNDGIKIHGQKIKIIELAMNASVNLEKKIIISKINAFWITSDLTAYIKQIRESAKYNQVMTLSTNADHANGALVAMSSQKTESGYKLLVNLNEAKNIHADLSANLLGTAIVIR